MEVQPCSGEIKIKTQIKTWKKKRDSFEKGTAFHISGANVSRKKINAIHLGEKRKTSNKKKILTKI